jgi:hypothetical protein
MTESAFLIFPLDPAMADPVDRELDAQLRARLSGYEVEHLSGIGGWTVRTAAAVDGNRLRAMLQGLAVEIADETRLTTL